MKYVTKQAEPAMFAEWKAKANEEWQPSYEALQNPEKRVLHTALLTEQGSVCCYCGRTISLADSHIEHFRPQESHQDLALDYRNLHASCIRETNPGTPLHCGHAKGSGFDEKRIISPLSDGCERRFIYSLRDGAIYPTDKADEAAGYMISLLKLDVSFLNERRAEVLKNVYDDEFLVSASEEELAQLARAFRAPDQTGRLSNFGHVLSRYAEQLLNHPV